MTADIQTPGLFTSLLNTSVILPSIRSIRQKSAEYGKKVPNTELAQIVRITASCIWRAAYMQNPSNISSTFGLWASPNTDLDLSLDQIPIS